MSGLDLLIAVGVTLVAMAVGIALRRAITAWFLYRGQRIVTCPENQQSAGVVVDAWHAAVTAPAREGVELRLTGCTRWPEHRDCDQKCLAQLESSPSDCLVKNMLKRWYDGKYCAWCGQPVGEAYWTSCKPVVLTRHATLLQWDEIPIGQLTGALATGSPVCFPCYARANCEIARHREAR